MNILLVSESYPPSIGGLETFFVNVAEGLAKLGHNVTVVTTCIQDMEAYDEINNIKIYRVRVPKKGGRYWFSLFAIPTVWKLVRDCDVVHTTTYTATFPAWFMAKIARKPCILTIHEVFLSMWRDLRGINILSATLHEIIERLVISLPFDRFVSVSNYTRKLVESIGIPRDKSAMIYNGVQSDIFNPKNGDGAKTRRLLGLTDNFVCLFYGRPGISKGVEDLIQSVPMITRRIKRFKLLLILAREPKRGFERIHNMIGELDIGKHVLLLDSVSLRDLPNYISCADCIVVPSLSEGFGLSVAESCAMKKPVIASNVGAIPEVISGKHLLVQAREPEEIAKAIKCVSNQEIIDETPEKVFNWDYTVESYAKIYLGLVNDERYDGK